MALSATVSIAQSAVIFGDAVLVPDFLMRSGYATLQLSQSIPSGEGLFAISISEVAANQFKFESQGIAEEYALFQVNHGLPFDDAFVSGVTPFVTNTGLVAAPTINWALGETKLFAYWDDRGAMEGNPDPGDNYGWVAIQRAAGGLVVHSGYTAVSSGIIVGTNQTIPEPATSTLLLSSALFGVFRRKRRA